MNEIEGASANVRGKGGSTLRRAGHRELERWGILRRAGHRGPHTLRRAGLVSMHSLRHVSRKSVCNCSRSSSVSTCHVRVRGWVLVRVGWKERGEGRGEKGRRRMKEEREEVRR
jgi:hypothetical protein